ncbi:mechanosensitive ion channel family protein [Helicobacter winghamensis]|uniref:Mechanosensitive ion channel protein MscS n=1 Tax=Helicobacter winghamensis TaxID=157268 RepID=A0A2N3PJU6_9HELI|nr:mechanosensitive ion channel domain-containing protein [Helicobacter winghamensis]EEO26311.1 small-conductance mechanosensitive channel [Helicobacter winghamensis ATCC BAA-430]PKT77298.1 mechanosensitive ion channel protein MscS [Helicobacter winghamensis]PKT77498.1 mechanosensitive ion channel protein MscS [Helicobacter winghamensis]PKT77769.1 mechanosensitive ion channel protein MscS [Helicobacter winghamensis]PKT81464.1 mechanosensitive ion channel protein MscS [Helicobacter winghamensis
MEEKFLLVWDRFVVWFFGFLPNIVSAFFILIIGYYVARVFSKYIAKLIAKATKDETLAGFLKNVAFVGIFVLAIITALTNLGVKTTSIIAVLGTAGLAIGLSLKDSLSNLASGILIVVLKQFRKGDVVTLNSITGRVQEVNLFQTKITTLDNQLVILPNSMIVSAPIINVNANPTRRLDLIFSVSYTSDLDKAKSILEEIFNAEEIVLKEPEPLIGVDVLNASSVDFMVRFWVNSSEVINAKLDLLQKVKMRFDAEGIEIPYNKLDINLNTPLKG